MAGLGLAELIVIFAIVALTGSLLTAIPYWFIFKKAGYHPALCFLMIVPVANIVMRFFLAFSEWPSLKKTSDASNVQSQ